MTIEISSNSVYSGQPGIIPVFNVEDMRPAHSIVKHHGSVTRQWVNSGGYFL